MIPCKVGNSTSSSILVSYDWLANGWQPIPQGGCYMIFVGRVDLRRSKSDDADAAPGQERLLARAAALSDSLARKRARAARSATKAAALVLSLA